MCDDNDPQNLCVTDLTSYVDGTGITDVDPDQIFYLGFSLPLLNAATFFVPNSYDHFMGENKLINSLKQEKQLTLKLYLTSSYHWSNIFRSHQQNFFQISVLLVINRARTS